MLPGQRRQRHDPSRSFPVDLRCQHGSTRFTQVGLPFPVLQGSPRWFLTCQKPPERPPVHPGPSGIIPVHHGGTTVQLPVLPGSPRSMERGEPGSTGSPVGLGHKRRTTLISNLRWCIITKNPLIGSSSGEPLLTVDLASSQSLLTRRPNDEMPPGLTLILMTSYGVLSS